MKKRPPINYKKMPEEKARQIEKGNDIFTIRLDKEGKQRAMLEKAKKILCVDRDSTAIKELAEVGFDVLHDSKIGNLVPKIVDRIRRGLYDSVLLSEEKMQNCNTFEDKK